MVVLSLRELSRRLLAELVVQEDSPCLATDLAASQLLLNLDQGAWGAESKAVLDRVVQRFPHRLTPRIALALLPCSATTISLKECSLVTEACINEVIKRCPHLQSLDLAGNSELNFNEIHLFKKDGGKVHQSLACISLEDCYVSDDIIHALLRNAPMLQSLNIARCNITDNVFLLNETKQLAREGGLQHSSLSTGYDSQLQSVDVTGCSKFSSTGVRHLCTLCGPSLMVLNMSWTKVDSTTLVYLCGLGLPGVVQFYLSLENKLPQAKLSGKPSGSKSGVTKREALLLTLTQFEQIAGQLREENEQSSQVNAGSTGLQDHHVSESPCISQDGTENYFVSGGIRSGLVDNSVNPWSTEVQKDDSCEGAAAISCLVSTTDVLQNINLDAVEDRLFSQNCDYESASPPSTHSKCLTSSGHEQSTCDRPADDQSSSVSRLCSDSTAFKISETQTSYEEECASIFSGAPFFTPNIRELCISGTVFSDAPASQHCLHQFLESNPNLNSLRLMGGLNGQSVTDEVLGQVTESCHALRHMSVEGCVHLTTAGVAKLAGCTQLEHLDLTGVAFIEDAGLVYLVKKLELSALLIAETRVKNRGLITLASQPGSHKLEELELSWCEDLEDDEGLNAVSSNCTSLRRLILRECGLSTKTLELIAANCHNLTELSLACCDLNIVCDQSVMLLSENLASLEVIDLSWNSNLTDVSISALLTNCHCLTTCNLSGLKRITGKPFMDIIAVPEELSQFISMKHKEWESDESTKIMLSDVPCLPHRSTVYATHLIELQLQYSDFVQDEVLNDIVAISLGSIKIVDYYGSEVATSETVIEKFVEDLFFKRCFGTANACL